jgi:Fe-S-cluster formation regulator IscX/YfhJ
METPKTTFSWCDYKTIGGLLKEKYPDVLAIFISNEEVRQKVLQLEGFSGNEYPPKNTVKWSAGKDIRQAGIQVAVFRLMIKKLK